MTSHDIWYIVMCGAMMVPSLRNLTGDAVDVSERVIVSGWANDFTGKIPPNCKFKFKWVEPQNVPKGLYRELVGLFLHV